MELKAENIEIENNECFCGKIASIESGLYENGEEKLREYINENYCGCKVCYVCESLNYVKFSNLTKGFDSESIFLLSDDDATKKYLDNVKNVIENSSLIVCLDNDSVDFAKYVSEVCQEYCLFYFEKMPTLDCFLPVRKSERCELSLVNCNPIKHYIICYHSPNELNREDLIDSIFSCFAYLCNFLEEVLNTILFRKRLSEKFKNDFLSILQKLNEFLHQIYFMPEDFLDNYLIFLEEFASILIEQEMEFETKENIFANVFNYLCRKKDLSMSEVRIVGAQAFCRIYYQFFNSLDEIQLNYFDIQKKLELLDQYFQGVEYELDNYVQMDMEEVVYLLSKHKDKISKKVHSYVKMLEQMLDRALDLYDDSGYLFSKKLNQEMALKAIYFTPDFLKGESLLKIIRDFGVLDYL